MKKFLIAFAIAMTLGSLAQAFEDSRKNADDLFAQRDLSEAGAQKALAAAEMYERLTGTAKASDKNSLWIGASRAYYFVGNLKNEKKDKIEIFQKGMDAVANVTKAYIPELSQANLEAVSKDVLAKVNPNEVLELAHALYYASINLGSWAEANGITQSLSKWPILRNYLMLVELLGHKQINKYGSSRVLGRAYFRLPVLAGGDKEKARKYLGEAFNETLQGNISTSGNNNVFYAELLYSDKKRDEAKNLLKTFIAANVDSLDPESIPENKAAQEVAKKILADWEE